MYGCTCHTLWTTDNCSPTCGEISAAMQARASHLGFLLMFFQCGLSGLMIELGVNSHQQFRGANLEGSIENMSDLHLGTAPTATSCTICTCAPDTPERCICNWTWTRTVILDGTLNVCVCAKPKVRKDCAPTFIHKSQARALILWSIEAFSAPRDQSME